MDVNNQTVISLGAGELDSLELKLANRTACVGVVGLGYVGLPLALLFADAGFRVTGFEVDAQKVEKLSRGESYIYRVPSTEVRVREAQLVVDTRNATRYPFIEDRAVLSLPSVAQERAPGKPTMGLLLPLVNPKSGSYYES